MTRFPGVVDLRVSIFIFLHTWEKYFLTSALDRLSSQQLRLRPEIICACAYQLGLMSLGVIKIH